jgi:mRNA interferase MazF
VEQGGVVAGRITRGEVRLYSFAPPDKARPVLVLTRASAIGYLARITVAPITTSIRGVPSEVVIGPDEGMKQPCAVNLHNLVTVSKDDLGRRVAQLGEGRMDEVCRALAFALGCSGASNLQ